MRRWRVIIEGEAATKRFLRTAFVGAENGMSAREIARTEFEKDGDRFIKFAEVTREKVEADHAGIVSIGGHIFFG